MKLTPADSAQHRSPVRRYILARLGSLIGDRVADIVLPVAILAITGSATTAGAVAAAMQVPAFVGALHIGRIADRFSQKKLMLMADVCRFSVVPIIGVELAFFGARLLPLVGLALIVGTADSIFNAAAGVYLPALIQDQKQLAQVNGRLEAADAAGTLTGPALGGLALGRLGPFLSMLINALSYGVSAAIVCTLPDLRPQQLSEQDKSLVGGIREIINRADQRTLIVATVYMHLLAATAFLPIISNARDQLGLTPGAIGLLLSTAGVGGLVSSLVVARRIPLGHWRASLSIILIVNALGISLACLSNSLPVVFVSVFLMDGASALAFVIAVTVRQSITRREVLGRTISATSAATAAVRIIGVLIAGTTIDTFGPKVTAISLGILAIPVGGYLLLRNATQTRT